MTAFFVGKGKNCNVNIAKMCLLTCSYKCFNMVVKGNEFKVRTKFGKRGTEMFDQSLVFFSEKTFENKFDVIKDLANLVSNKVTSSKEYFDAVKEREDTLATYVEYGVAIPHAKTDAVTEPFVVYEKLENGVVWGNNGEIANYIFMIGVPQKYAGNLHLKIISELSKNLMREEFRNKLLNAESAEYVYELLMLVEKEILK